MDAKASNAPGEHQAEATPAAIAPMPNSASEVSKAQQNELGVSPRVNEKSAEQGSTELDETDVESEAELGDLGKRLGALGIDKSNDQVAGKEEGISGSKADVKL